jgi:hypothetical protein
MLIDSEEPLDNDNVSATWRHLSAHDDWQKPQNATDEQVLFMTTCMETWIVADRSTLSAHFGHSLQDSGLPPLDNLERRSRRDVQDALQHATRSGANAYAKGKQSFIILGKLDPEVLARHLPSFVRAKDILHAKL